MLINVLIPGFIKSFGVLFDDVCDRFDASPAAVSWIPALSFFMYNFMGEWRPRRELPILPRNSHRPPVVTSL